MREAGLTHGGFYRHFDSRDDLIAEAVDAALTDGSRRTEGAAAIGGLPALRTIIDGYLSQLHRDAAEKGCAVGALPADVARCSTSARATYARHVRRYIKMLAGLTSPAKSQRTREDEALLILSALVGALSMARAVEETELSDEILAGTARALHEFSANERRPAQMTRRRR